MSTAVCFDRCNACGHVHRGSDDNYRCPSCPCADRFTPDDERGAA